MAASISKKRKVEDTNNSPNLSAFAVLAQRRRPAQESSSLVSSPNHPQTQGLPKTSKKTIETGENSGLSEGDPPVVIPPTVLQLSTIRPSQTKKSGNEVVKVLLEPGDRLVVLGQYDLSVSKGCVKILGASLYPSKKKYHVAAPSSHCLPVIRCDVDDLEAAEISLRQSTNGLDQLGPISPVFRRILNDSPSFLDYEDASEQRSVDMGSFRILYSIVDPTSRKLIRPVKSPPEWNELLSTLQNTSNSKSPTILVCGPKSAGKSTFSKLLINRFITSRDTSKIPVEDSVVVLDCDPGQPEHSPPGQLSLNFLKDPNFGPPFSHPKTSGTRNHLIRAHSIAAITPSTDPELYMACIRDLSNQYRQQYSSLPLVINTPGWILGTGLEILVELIQILNPTAVVYLSKEGPAEVVETLKEAAKSIPMYTLPSQGSDSTVRNSSSLRAMQTMSYFHLQHSTNNLSWDPTPLSSIPPLQIRYTGETSGILGILCLGDQPPPELLIEAINGSVLAIVVMDDPAAIPGYNYNDKVESSTIDSTIVRTPEQLPYFNPQRSIKLDPQYSQTIGCLLVRGVDTKHRRLQVLTPVAPKTFQEIREAGKAIVLVSGKLDTPGWAYTEELHKRAWMEKQSADTGEDSESEEAGGTEAGEFENTPWVEKVIGGQGRGEGGRVWKVRRDLGKKAG